MNKTSPNPDLLKVLPNDDILQQCIHCGMCLATCPTYDLTKLERSSPRGRIRMIRSVARGEMELSALFAEEMNFCLDCQACETACPAGVKYGRMVETARVIVDQSVFTPKLKLFIKRFVLRKILASRFALKFVSRLLWIHQKTGLQKLIRLIGLLKLFSEKLPEVEKLSPQIANHFSDSIIKEIELPQGEIKYKTAFHFGCLMNTMFSEINTDTIDVLKNVGCKIITPKDQVCCGSLMAHNGDIEFALNLARKNIDAFIKHEYDYLISNSAGCGAFMKDYAHLLENDPLYSEKARIFSSKVKDVTEFLYSELPALKEKVKASVELEPVTYHDACHLIHAQKVSTQPREIIKSIPGIKYTELDEASWCCGSAGIYNVVRYDDSLIQLQRKMKNIRNTGAKIVLTGNPGCMGQIKYGAEKFDVDVEVLHPVTLIKRIIE
ncbi:(Fe-S)-binding protein [Ignavibacterium sp.]|uniref:(Fe-S)-binding protein n=1 Tax=Ignavibacterium sp. TaxID=2651167 RepID=UPI00307F79CD